MSHANCRRCGAVVYTTMTEPLCRQCARQASPKLAAALLPPSSWAVIHQRFADARLGLWNPDTEKAWYQAEWLPTIPAHGCACNRHWAELTAKHPIDWTTAESAFRSLWFLHNEVSTRHAGNPPLSYEQCRSLWTGPKVAFLSTAYQAHGGTETFHRTLLPRLRHHRNIIGFAATGSYAGDGALLKVPYSTGIDAAKALAGKADVVVTWGIDSLASLLPANRPKVISVHHADYSSEWSNNLTLQQLESIDAIVCVNRDVAERLRAAMQQPVYYIPNTVDPSRINPSAEASQLRSQNNIGADAPIVLFGHRMSAEKQPKKALEVARLLPDGWVMVMAGDGPQLDEVRKLAGENVRIVGHVDTLAGWLSVADRFISLSVYEGFGLSVAEALAAGVPVVATPAGIAIEKVDLLIPHDAPPATWAAALLQHQANPVFPCELERFVADWAEIL